MQAHTAALSTLLPSAMIATARRRGDPIRFSTSTIPMVALETSKAISSISYSKPSPLEALSCCQRSSITHTQRSTTDLSNLADHRVTLGHFVDTSHFLSTMHAGCPRMTILPLTPTCRISTASMAPSACARTCTPARRLHAGPACWASGAPSAASTRPPKPPSTSSAASGNST